MKKDLVFNSNSVFKSVAYDKEAGSWQFYFADKIYTGTSGFWRLLLSNKIIFVSLDHGQHFGHPQPVDLVGKVTSLLTGKKLTEIRVDKDTADLTLTFTEEILIQIFISSSGYETYDFFIDEKRYTGLGSGELGILGNA